jgi:hypothetical protein
MAAFQSILTMQFQGVSWSGQAWRNTYHFRKNPTSGNVDATFLTALAADSNTTSLINKYLACLTVLQRLDGVLVRATRDPLFPGDDRDEAFRQVDAPGTRATPSGIAPEELGAMLKLAGDLAGRRFRGRIWLPPIVDRGVVNGESYDFTSGYATAVANLASDLTKTTYPSGAGHFGGSWNDVDMIVFSRKGRSLDQTYYARVSAIQRPPKVHWLRSRNPTNA